MGWAQFGILNTITKLGMSQFFKNRFQAAVAIYPDCSNFITSTFNAPLLALIGDTDSARRIERCRKMVKASAKGLMPVNIKIYHGAEPGFDDPDVAKGVYRKGDWNWAHMPKRGVLYKYDRDAHEDSILRIKQFLNRHLN